MQGGGGGERPFLRLTLDPWKQENWENWENILIVKAQEHIPACP